jgi:hypothetical protein
MTDDLEMFVYGIKLAKRNQSAVKQILALSAIVIGALGIAAVAGSSRSPLPCQDTRAEFVVIGSGLYMLRT